MKHNVLILTLAAAVLAGGMVFNTQAAVDGPAPRRAALKERAKEKLGITDEQVAKIKAALAPEKETLTATMKRLHSARADLRETIQQPDASEKSIRDAAAKVATVEAEAAVLRARLYKNITAVLTAEQVAKLKEMQSHAGKFVERIIDRVGGRLGE